MKSEFSRQVVDRGWLSGLSGGQNVAYRIHSGGVRSPVEKHGCATVVRAGKRYLELGSDVFDGQIARQTGRGNDGRGRTIVISEPPVAVSA